VVAIKAAPDGTKYKVKWYADGATPTSLGEYELSSSGTRNLDFTYKPPARGAAEGAYHIELYENGNLVDNIPFSVSQAANDNTATATPVAVQVGFIDQVVLAKDVEPDTYKPIDVTTAFSPGDPYIHFVVHLNEAPAQTKLTVTLLQDDIIELKTLSVTTPDSGSRFADFSFTPPDGGWEMGDYSMVLYVNDQLNQSVAFSVK
jgi:hypothetical protein